MSVLFMTGAGISANAGIPTYRDGGSSWTDPELEKKSHATRYGNHLEELWDKHWGPMSIQMLDAQPTDAHKAIAAFQKKHESIVATQNIDDLHELAGSDNIAHVHGSLRAICMRCKSHDVETWVKGIPACRNCEAKKSRPDAVLFGEALDAKMFAGLDKYARTCSHIIVVGTSLNVFPFAGLVMDNFSNPQITTVLINKDPTPFNKYFDFVFDKDADLWLESILNVISNEITNKELDD